MDIEWDFSELTKFATNLSGYETETALMTVAQKVAKVLHQYLLIQTPVDTGNLRKMWSANNNLQFTVKSVATGFEVTFINTARANSKNGFMYGVAVNDGHKTPGGNGWVMGRFFVEKAILQTANSTETEQIIFNELQKWWDSL